MPKISVIVPVYKVEQYLNRCVDSILNQTYKDFELILVDDGSPDNCPKICDEYALKDSRVKVIHKQNGGLSDARNFGIDYAFTTDSEWITFIDSDDWVHKQYLEILYNSAINNNVLISSCALTSKEFELVSNVVIVEPNDLHKSEIYFKIPIICACSKLFYKDLFRDIKFPFGKINEDRFTTYKLFFSVKKIAINFSKLYYYYIRNDSITHSNWSLKNLDDIEACEQEIEFYSKNNYFFALQRTLESIFHLFSVNISKLKLYKEKKLYRKYISKLRKYLRKYSKFVKTDLSIYLVAYPILNIPYKIKKIFKGKHGKD